MNNRHPSDTANPPGDDLLKAAKLVARGMKQGVVKINLDGLILVNGVILFAPDLTAVGNTDKVSQQSLNQFLFDGKTWTLQFDGMVVTESDRIGLHYINQFIQRPRREFHSTDLVTGAYGESDDAMKPEELLESGVAVTDDDIDEITGNVDLQVITTEFADEILPDENRAFVFGLLETEYKQLAKFEKKGLPREVLMQKEKIKADIKKIKKYLEVHRYRGKNVCFETRADKDRKSVAKAIKEAIARIAKKNPFLAEHLRKSIKTGIYCSYQPEAETHWQVAIKWRPVSSK